MQTFSNGSIYYGNFLNDNMHGIGSMILPNNKYMSANMNMDSFDEGLILHSNLTLFMKDKEDGKELIHQVEIESGTTKCTELDQNKPPKLYCTTDKGVNGFYHKYKGDCGMWRSGFCSQDKNTTFYRQS